jgi:hypothetical protein
LIVDLPLDEQHHDQAPLLVADGVQLRVQAALGSRDAARTAPFSAKLAAVRWAFRCVLSSHQQLRGAGLGGELAEDPLEHALRLQRTKRLYNGLSGPWPRGASFHCRPWRIT